MKKIILLSIILIFLTGCGGIYNQGNFVLPNDIEFLNLIEELNTPEKTCKYMEDNFEYENNLVTLTPYQLLLIKKGNCDDFSNFATFFPNYNGYEIYQILIEFLFYEHEDDNGDEKYHMIGVFKEGDYYNISENMHYVECFCESFEDIMNFNLYHGWISYIVYDYDMKIVEQGYNN